MQKIDKYLQLSKRMELNFFRPSKAYTIVLSLNKNQFRHSVIPTLKKIILPEKKNTFLNFFFKHQLILLCYDPRWLQINFAHHVLFSKKTQQG